MQKEPPQAGSEIAVTQAEAVIGQAVTNGAIRYIHGCESRIDEFVRRHYSFRGALRIHSYAIGWDIVRVPVNILWSVVNIILAAVGFLSGLLRLRRFQRWIKRIPPGLETDMDRQISWLVVTELLQLPHEHAGRKSVRDGLMEEIVKDPSLQRLLNAKLEAFEGRSQAPDFQTRLHAKLIEYAATRTCSADLASNAALLISSKIVLGDASFGTLSAGTAVSTAVAHSLAVSKFWLGSTIGAYYYALIPVAVSMQLRIAVTAIVAIFLAFVSTFIGILTDPIQARLGLHQRRLKKLTSSIRDDLLGKHETNFQLREKYMGRLFDVLDVLTTVGRAI
jgi:Family of unknown function (DUF6635)